ncbi:lysophospholipid acyltransferase family protein [Levilinea saccharolytica]|uniref:Lauroyl/myristoyl acyltransferase n=1 Tax=Levilinea saccharolytica TaxID=229921 RepID=A0A0M8JR37_9CHLR|nr:lysophospholipid acyltransferase family protein [Levilinea saccharolytica]KPL87441.1 hypothetical protein ADN01_04590 [Levilinea saccharolytica]GAP19718.1 lauroyl/myristoyl acyltransferase [Levilinea saccharolytica]
MPTQPSLVQSRLGVRLALGLARALPPRLGVGLGEFLGSVYGRLTHLPQVQAVCANQWVISGGSLSAADLRRQARAVFRMDGRALYDFYHRLNDPAGLLALVDFDPSYEELMARCREERQGILLLGTHTANFDLAGRATALRGVPLLVLSYPQPPGGYQMQNQLRQVARAEIEPISPSALRQAVERLRSGGTVVTGIDRPIHGSNYPVQFFGRPAQLPVGHVRLALKTKAWVYLMGARYQPTGRLRVWALGPIPMRPDEDLQRETTRNAEAILAAAEEIIRPAPQQWSMFYPVWPDVQPPLP